MLVTIHELGPRDGEIIPIRDGALVWKFVLPLPFSELLTKPAQDGPPPVSLSGEPVIYTVQEYRNRTRDTRFALVHPDLRRRMLGC